MPQLTAPDTRFHTSFVKMLAEFEAEGPLSDWAARLDFAALRTSCGFARYVADLHARRVRRSSDPEGPIGESSLFWAEGDEFIGRVAVRHRLNAKLERFGGHIGYAIRPSAQGMGHASALLRATLPVAYALGIDDALLTTDPDNHASRRVIEKCGGRLVKQTGDHCYYRLRTMAGDWVAGD
jgi:predicted acetyltransferase